MGDNMYCRKCGEPIPEGGEFCMICGTHVIDETATKGDENSTKKRPLKATIITLLSVIIIAIITFVVLFFTGILTTNTEAELTKEDLLHYGISTQDGIISFTSVIGGNFYTNITYEYSGDSYDQIYSKDFMDEPIDLTLHIKTDTGDTIDTALIKGFMVIDTDVDNSVLYGYYKNAKTLYIHDPNYIIESKDILEFMQKLESLYLDGFSDISGLNDLIDITTLKTLSLSSMEINCLPEIGNTSIVNLSLCTLPITDLEGIEDSETIAVLTLLNLKNLDTLDEVKDIPSLKEINTGNLPSISKELLSDLKQKFLSNDASVYIDVIPIDLSLIYEPTLEVEDINVGIICSDTNEYNKIIAESFITFAELEGINIIPTYSQGNAEKELMNAIELIELGADALVVIPVGNNDSIRTLELANKSSVPIFYIGTVPSKKDESHDVTGEVRYSVPMTGYNLGLWLANNHSNATAVYIPNNMMDVESYTLIVGFNTGLQTKALPLLTVLEPSFGDISKAEQIIEDLVESNKHFDVVFVHDENLFEAIRDKLISLGVKDKIIISTFGRDKCWSDIEDGSLSATLPLPPTLLADLSIQQLVSYFNEDAFSYYLYTFIPEPLTSENLHSAIPWEITSYIEGRIRGDFVYDMGYYTDILPDNFDIISEILEETLTYMKNNYYYK